MRSSIGLGILSWRGYETLVPVLESLRGFSDMFGELYIYFNEIDDEGRSIASDFGFDYGGSPENTGIYGGFRGLAESMSSDYVLFLENDWHLVESIEVGSRLISGAYDLLSSGRADICHLRHLRIGVDMMHGYRNYLRYYPLSPSFFERLVCGVRHLLRPGKARFNVGGSVYVLDNPEDIFAEISRDVSTGFYLMPCAVRGWINHPFMLSREFFISEILSRVEVAPSVRLVNGFKSIEHELDRVWWQDQSWVIGVSDPGLFHHDRIGDRGY